MSSAPPPMVAAGPGQPSSSYAQSAAGPPGPQPGDAVARGLGWAWIALSVFTAAACALPFVQLGDQSWSTFALAEPATHAGEPHEVGNNVLGWLIAVPMILVGLLGLPAALGNGRAVWALIAVPGCLWSTFITLGLYATVFPADADTEVSPAAGAFLLPAIGALTLFVIVAAAVKRR